MAAASYFETKIRESIESFAGAASNSNSAVVSLVKAKALERQYHTYFDWEKRNANKFFSCFGEAFKSQCHIKVSSNERLCKSISAFLELGDMRNKLAHLNFALFPIEKTSDEVYALYKEAHGFLDFVKGALEQASRGHTQETEPCSENTS